MIHKYKLTTTLGEIFKYNGYIIGIGFLGFLIYTVTIKDIAGIFTCLLLILFLYVKFISKFIKFKNITFDDKSIYVEDDIISLKEINHIEKGKIVVGKNGKEKKYFYNYFYGTNYEVLMKFYKAETEIQ